MEKDAVGADNVDGQTRGSTRTHQLSEEQGGRFDRGESSASYLSRPILLCLSYHHALRSSFLCMRGPVCVFDVRPWPNTCPQAMSVSVRRHDE